MTLAENRYLRFAVVFMLYFCQGAPIGFFEMALPAWLVANGASPTAVGLIISAALLPWSLKLINGFIMDRFSFAPMGMRRPWLIGAQVCIVVGFLALASISPTPSQVWMIAVFAFAVNVATSFQDVAVDGLAVDIIPDEERGKANGFMFGGQAFGIAASAAISGVALATLGISAAAALLGGVILFSAIVLLTVRERSGERLLPWTTGITAQVNLDRKVAAWIPLMRTVFGALVQSQTLKFLAASLIYGISYGLFLAVAPVFAVRELGLDESAYGSIVGGMGLITAVIAILVIGPVVDKIGARRFALIAMIVLACVHSAMLMLGLQMKVVQIFVAFAVCVMILDITTRICISSIGMRLSLPSVAASQFALFMAVPNLGLSVGSALLGPIEAAGGFPALFTALIIIAATAASLLTWAKVGR